MLRLLRVFGGRYRMRPRYREAASRRSSSVSSYSPERVSPTQHPVSPSRKVHAVSHPRHPVEHAVVGQLFRVGMWRSLVAHLTGGQGVAGSNPVIPTIFHRVLRQVPPPRGACFCVRGHAGVTTRHALGPPVPMSRTRATPPGARSCRARAGISGCPIGLCDVGGLTACRLLDSSADLRDVRDCLGHAQITTTSRYVRGTPVRGVPLAGEALGVGTL